MSDNFDDGVLNGWIQAQAEVGVTGKFYVDKGELVFESSEDQGAVGAAIGTGSEVWINYVVEVDTKITKHQFNAMGWEVVGFILRRTPNGNYSFFFGSSMLQKVVAICRIFGNQNFAMSLTKKKL